MKYLQLLLIVLIVAVAGWLAESHRSHNFSVTFFDVGQGDSSLVQFPDGTTVLIDGGPNRTVLTKLGQYLPWGRRSIEVVILSHPHADHVTGLTYVLERYRVGRVIMTGVVHTIPEYAAFLSLIRDKHIPVTLAQAGQTMWVGQDGIIEFFWPRESYAEQRVADLNSTSIVNRISYQNVSVLFTGDTPIENEATMLAAGEDMRAQILKVGHQGSYTSSSEEFLRAVAPEVAVIPVGKDNRYGHPHAEIVERLKNLAHLVLRTDEEGDIRFVSDGQNWQRR